MGIGLVVPHCRHGRFSDLPDRGRRGPPLRGLLSWREKGFDRGPLPLGFGELLELRVVQGASGRPIVVLMGMVPQQVS